MKSPLIKKAKAGDIDALNRLLENYRDTAYSIALRILRNEQDAEDVVQNSYISVFRAIGKFRNESQFSTWLYRIVYNESIRARKSGSQIHSSEISDEIAIVDYPVIDDSLQKLVESERRQLILRAMDSMQPNESLVLTLFYLEDKSIREIHSIAGFSKSNIKVILHRARKNLYTILTRMMKPEMDGAL